MNVRARNRLLREAGRLETLSDANEQLIPELARLTNASFVFAYRGLANEQGIRAYLPPSTPDLIADYFAEYAGECPLRRVKELTEDRVVPTTALYGHGRLLKTRVYNELWRPWGFDHHVAMRFDDPEGGPETASLGLMINRDHHSGEYSDEELSFLRSLVPSVQGALRRAAQVEVLREKVEALESLLEAGGTPGPKIILGADGEFIHAVIPQSSGAEGVVAAIRTARHPVRLAARRLARVRDDETFELEHRVNVEGVSWRASLSLIQSPREGRTLVLVALASFASERNAWSLTPSEQAVLEQLAAGLNNAEIGGRLFISPETVRTHLTRIYKKLGVRSRLEAVLKAKARLRP